MIEASESADRPLMGRIRKVTGSPGPFQTIACDVDVYMRNGQMETCVNVVGANNGPKDDKYDVIVCVGDLCDVFEIDGGGMEFHIPWQPATTECGDEQ